MEILKSSPILTTEQFQIDLGQVLAIIGFNSFIFLTPFGNQTLSDVTEKKFRSVFFSGDVGSRIGEVFLLNSKLLRGDLANAKSISKYFELEAAFATAANDFKERETKNIRLPEPGKINSSYGFLANKRRSIRNYKKSPLRLEQLSTILHHAVGLTGHGEVEYFRAPPAVLESVRRVDFRASPSPGGLYPNSVYVIALNVRGLKPGAYKYNVRNNALEVISEGVAREELLHPFDSQREVIKFDDAQCIFAIVMNVWKIERKYGERGIRFGLLEAGYISQNVHLATNGLDLGSCDVGGFYDDELETILKLGGINDIPLHCLIIGKPASENRHKSDSVLK